MVPGCPVRSRPLSTVFERTTLNTAVCHYKRNGVQYVAKLVPVFSASSMLLYFYRVVCQTVAEKPRDDPYNLEYYVLTVNQEKVGHRYRDAR